MNKLGSNISLSIVLKLGGELLISSKIVGKLIKVVFGVFSYTTGPILLIS